jgi:polyhydroxyalkanoate synthase
VTREMGAAAVAESRRKGRSPAGVFACPRPNDVVIDLGAVDLDTYAVAGLRDHLVSWEAASPSARVFGGRKRFVVSTSGHTQAQVNAPSPDSRSSCRLTDEFLADSLDFFRQADVKPGSRWPAYAEWLGDRSGERVPALKAFRSSKHRASDRAPGHLRPRGVTDA